MKSLVRLLIENRINLVLAGEPTICGDDILKHDDRVRAVLKAADEETVGLILEVIGEMAEKSRENQDESRSYALEDLPVDMGLVPSEDDLEFHDPENPKDNPAIRPRLENPLELLAEVLVADILYYSFFEVEADFAREQLARIGEHLREESPVTIQASIASTRMQAERIPDQKRYQWHRDLLVAMPYDLGLIADPR